jgi:hypothetical protein
VRFIKKQELSIMARSKRTTTFIPALYTFSNPLVTTQVKTECNQEFAERGFPRITFEWDLPTLTGSDWNNATALILLEHWTHCYQNQPGHDQPLAIHGSAIVDRWLGTMLKHYQNKRSQKNSSQSCAKATALREKNEDKKKHCLKVSL